MVVMSGSSPFVCVFKQKTAYEMLISDGRSDVCSSDLGHHRSLPEHRPRSSPGRGRCGLPFLTRGVSRETWGRGRDVPALPFFLNYPLAGVVTLVITGGQTENTAGVSNEGDDRERTNTRLNSNN